MLATLVTAYLSLPDSKKATDGGPVLGDLRALYTVIVACLHMFVLMLCNNIYKYASQS